MSAPAKAPVTTTVLSGFCGYSDDHGRCQGTQPDRHLRCDCTCHTSAPAASPAGTAPAALVLISESSRASQPDVEYDLGDALQHLAESVDVLDRAVTAFEGAPEELLDLLGQVRRDRQHLHQMESSVELRCAKAMTQDVVEWPGGVAERRWGSPRKEWRNEELLATIRRHIVATVALVPDQNGVAVEDHDVARAVRDALDTFTTLARADWRTTALRAAGIDPDDYSTKLKARASVQVTLAEADA